VQGRPAGTWGDVGTLSFGGSKPICAGRGGALLVRDPQVYQRAKGFLHRGIQQWAPLSELQAAAIRPQLRKLPAMTAHRGANARALLEALAVPGLVPLTDSFGADPTGVAAFFKIGFRYDPTAFGLPRELFVNALRAEGIAFDVGFKGLHVGRSPSRFRAVGELPHATAAHHGCVVLHHPVLAGSSRDALQVADAVTKVYRNRSLLSSAAPG
jgi:dTDP-4-amino-4,6-dideoxygalactose transaminase